MTDYVIWFDRLGMGDVPVVGGKNASLGEMIQGLSHAGIRVPGGFATTADAFRDFLAHDDLADKINRLLLDFDVEDVDALEKMGSRIRAMVLETPFPAPLERAIREAWQQMSAESSEPVSVAVRSSATAEDLPEASFAGQQETFLNVVGVENVLLRVKEVFASLYNDRAISYRVHQGFEHADVALSAGIQRMVRSDAVRKRRWRPLILLLKNAVSFRSAMPIAPSWHVWQLPSKSTTVDRWTSNGVGMA